MLALRIVGLLAVASASSGQTAIWPGPEAISTIFTPADSPVLYQGDGGTVTPVRGIDFWIIGRPSRVNRLLGTVAINIAPLKSRQTPQLNDQQFNTLIEDTVVKAATTAGASAAILMHGSKDSDGTSHLYYRLVLYLPEGTAPDAPIQKDQSLVDADGNKVQNGFETPVRTLQIPDMGEGNRRHLEGTALVRVCVGIDGAVSSSTIVTSSGLEELDALALKAVNKARYAPATVAGRPIGACKDLKLTWKNH
jgi:TonB family protein